MTLEKRTLEVGGTTRTYLVARRSAAPAPLLLVFHGLGIGAKVMAQWTALDERGPAAGFATVFPEGVAEMWDDTGHGRVDGIDDEAFVSALVQRLTEDGMGRDGRLMPAGLSNGATFVEHLVRRHVVEARGMVLVAGTARRISHDELRPAGPCAVLMFAGTSDPNVPYAGGPASRLPGWIARRRIRGRLARVDGRESVAPETLAAEWAATNGCDPTPIVDRVATTPDDLPVERLIWSGNEAPPVVLYRIIGGGHAWPGGGMHVPRLLFGRISRSLDATGIALDFASRTIS